MPRLHRQQNPNWTRALEFWGDAQMYLTAADAVRGSKVAGTDEIPAMFLYGRTIELALKAFLLARGETTQCLRKKELGHDLSALYRLARRRQMGREVLLAKREADAVERLSGPYAAKRLEYRRSGPYSLPMTPAVASAAKRLVRGLRPVCVRRLFPNL